MARVALVTVNGGAIALGHPIGASGTRVFVTLLHEMIRRDAKKGLATRCLGGGLGSARCVARDGVCRLKRTAVAASSGPFRRA